MKNEIAILAIIAFCFTAIGYMGGRFDTKKDVCIEKGGILIDSPSGWICIKGEKI